MVLTNGAQACNVYWQVGSSATIGSSSTLIGNVLALTTITANDGGSTVNGRLLARNGAVTLNNTTLTKQTCAVGTSGGPTATPTPTPSSSSSSSSSNSSSTSNSAPPCVAPKITNVPRIIESKRLSPTSVSIKWGPYAGTDTFNVRYGLTNGNWLYNTDVTGFSTTIGGLPANQPIWVQVATRNQCSIGEYSEALLIGGPKLPNAGYGPNEKNFDGHE